MKVNKENCLDEFLLKFLDGQTSDVETEQILEQLSQEDNSINELLDIITVLQYADAIDEPEIDFNKQLIRVKQQIHKNKTENNSNLKRNKMIWFIPLVAACVVILLIIGFIIPNQEKQFLFIAKTKSFNSTDKIQQSNSQNIIQNKTENNDLAILQNDEINTDFQENTSINSIQIPILQTDPDMLTNGFNNWTDDENLLEITNPESNQYGIIIPSKQVLSSFIDETESLDTMDISQPLSLQDTTLYKYEIRNFEYTALQIDDNNADLQENRSIDLIRDTHLFCQDNENFSEIINPESNQDYWFIVEKKDTTFFSMEYLSKKIQNPIKDLYNNELMTDEKKDTMELSIKINQYLLDYDYLNWFLVAYFSDRNIETKREEIGIVDETKPSIYYCPAIKRFWGDRMHKEKKGDKKKNKRNKKKYQSSNKHYKKNLK